MHLGVALAGLLHISFRVVVVVVESDKAQWNAKERFRTPPKKTQDKHNPMRTFLSTFGARVTSITSSEGRAITRLPPGTVAWRRQKKKGEIYVVIPRCLVVDNGSIFYLNIVEFVRLFDNSIDLTINWTLVRPPRQTNQNIGFRRGTQKEKIEFVQDQQIVYYTIGFDFAVMKASNLV